MCCKRVCKEIKDERAIPVVGLSAFAIAHGICYRTSPSLARSCRDPIRRAWQRRGDPRVHCVKITTNAEPTSEASSKARRPP